MRLRIIRGAHSGAIFSLEQGSNLIGRWDPDAGAFPEIDLEQHDPEAKVSRKHAVIELKGNEATLQDIGSLNGTFINRGPRLEPGVRYTIAPGDELIIGKTFLVVEASTGPVSSDPTRE